MWFKIELYYVLFSRGHKKHFLFENKTNFSKRVTEKLSKTHQKVNQNIV